MGHRGTWYVRVFDTKLNITFEPSKTIELPLRYKEIFDFLDYHYDSDDLVSLKNHQLCDKAKEYTKQNPHIMLEIANIDDDSEDQHSGSTPTYVSLYHNGQAIYDGCLEQRQSASDGWDDEMIGYDPTLLT